MKAVAAATTASPTVAATTSSATTVAMNANPIASTSAGNARGAVSVLALASKPAPA